MLLFFSVPGKPERNNNMKNAVPVITSIENKINFIEYYL